MIAEQAELVSSFYGSEEQPDAVSSFRTIAILDNFEGKYLGLSDRVMPRWAKLFSIIIENYCYNLVEFGKALIRRRPCNFRKIVNLGIQLRPHSSQVSFNLISGAMVVLSAQSVHKFFFKNLDYYTSLYTYLGNFFPAEVITYKKSLVLHSQRFVHCPTNKFDLSEFHNQLRETMRLLNSLAAPEELKKYLSVQYKFELLCSTYGIDNDIEECASYKSAISLIQNVLDSQNIELYLVHGDVWIGNIILDSRGIYRIIDFDKCMYFCGCYDQIYFYLMNNKRMWLEQIQCHNVDLSKLIKEASGYLRDYLRIIEISDLEIALCVSFFILCKAVEKDFSDQRLGRSADHLVSEFNKVLLSIVPNPQLASVTFKV